MNKISSLTLILLLANYAGSAQSTRILAFLPFFATSHNKIGQSISKAYIESNVTVTLVTCFPSGREQNINYREISTEDFLSSFFKGK